MKLRPDVSLSDFLRQVNLCEGDVYFETPEGDSLNIKSQLSKYVFLAAVTSEKDLAGLGEVVCKKEKDVFALREYLVECV